MSDPATLAWYEANAPRYDFAPEETRRKRIDAFLAQLALGAQVLELGCGGGHDSAYMAERGFIVDATDAAAAMVRKASETYGLPVRQMRFDELAADAAYDAVWAHACLLHVSRPALADVLARIRRALRPGGWHFANFKLGSGEGRDPLGRLNNFPDRQWLDDSYRAAGFTVVGCEGYTGAGADGVKREWYALTLQVPDE